MSRINKVTPEGYREFSAAFSGSGGIRRMESLISIMTKRI